MHNKNVIKIRTQDQGSCGCLEPKIGSLCCTTHLIDLQHYYVGLGMVEIGDVEEEIKRAYPLPQFPFVLLFSISIIRGGNRLQPKVKPRSHLLMDSNFVFSHLLWCEFFPRNVEKLLLTFKILKNRNVEKSFFFVFLFIKKEKI